MRDDSPSTDAVNLTSVTRERIFLEISLMMLHTERPRASLGTRDTETLARWLPVVPRCPPEPDLPITEDSEARSFPRSSRRMASTCFTFSSVFSKGDSTLVSRAIVNLPSSVSGRNSMPRRRIDARLAANSPIATAMTAAACRIDHCRARSYASSSQRIARRTRLEARSTGAIPV